MKTKNIKNICLIYLDFIYLQSSLLRNVIINEE